MRPMRGRFGGGFGGGIPGLEAMSAKLAIGLVAGSVLFLLTRNTGGALLLLRPGMLGSFLWQPLSYAFIETSPMGIIFGAIIIWSIGGWLEGVWGPKRMLLVALGCTALAGLLTAVAAFVIPVAPVYAGGSVMASILWVAYGLVIGRGQTNFWGIPLSGNAFAGIGAGFVVLRVLTSGDNVGQGLLYQLPEVLGLIFVFIYMRGVSPRRLWLQIQHWRLQRQLRGRARNLRVVSSERPNDRFLN
jgi:membrane associated rhomboid family serine protease